MVNSNAPFQHVPLTCPLGLGNIRTPSVHGGTLSCAYKIEQEPAKGPAFFRHPLGPASVVDRGELLYVYLPVENLCVLRPGIVISRSKGLPLLLPFRGTGSACFVHIKYITGCVNLLVRLGVPEPRSQRPEKPHDFLPYGLGSPFKRISPCGVTPEKFGNSLFLIEIVHQASSLLCCRLLSLNSSHHRGFFRRKSLG